MWALTRVLGSFGQFSDLVVYTILYRERFRNDVEFKVLGDFCVGSFRVPQNDG